jgi:signal transduction histidine kinase
MITTTDRASELPRVPDRASELARVNGRASDPARGSQDPGQVATPEISEHAEALLAAHNERIRTRTDRLFAALLLAEWLGCVVSALIVSPRQWAGAESGIHVHVCAAVLLGGAIVVIPTALALFTPGRATTRHAVAIAQILISALLIHLTGGRIETHFMIFGSLAFLAFYRDWKILVTATLVTAADHFLRGIFYPQSVYGVMGGAEWRFLEHAWWVVFEDIFLIVACVQAQNEMRQIAVRHDVIQSSSRLLAVQGEEARRLAAKNEQLAIEALAATKAKSEFLATMSHELRTPMNAIINYADLAIRRGAKAIVASSDSAALQQQHRFASEIRTAGERLLSLINQLLDLSRIEAGRLEVHVEDASGTEVVARVRKIADALVETNQNELVTTCDPDLRFRTDVQKLEQCIINLVGNAAKFTHRGRITLKLTRSKRPNTVIIAVSDTGIGMTAEQLERLFIPFNQADSSITRQYGGSGLGLAITKSIVTLLGGTVGVTSELHMGSTFTITLPLVYELAVASNGAVAAPVRQSPAFSGTIDRHPATRTSRSET